MTTTTTKTTTKTKIKTRAKTKAKTKTTTTTTFCAVHGIDAGYVAAVVFSFDDENDEVKDGKTMLVFSKMLLYLCS